MARELAEYAAIAARFALRPDDGDLLQWPRIAETGRLPSPLEGLLPPGVGFRLLFPGLPDGEFRLHDRFVHRLLREGLRFSGTLDAAADPEYRSLYEARGWRTVFHLVLRFRHEELPETVEGGERAERGAPMLPAVIHAEEAEALDPGEFARVLLAVRAALSAVLLRLQLSFAATQAKRFRESFPVAYLLLSRNAIYETNEEGTRWFGIRPSGHDPAPVAESLPRELVRWLRRTIDSGRLRRTPRVAHSEWMELRDGREVFVRALLQRYRPLEHIPLHETLTTGFKGIDAFEADEKIFLLTLIDQTAHWEAEQLQREIVLAREMQKSLLPLRVPETPEFGVAAICRPAGHVGGDFYDVQVLPDGRLAVFLGDAAGHGVDSSLLAALAAGAYRAGLAGNPEPASVMSAIDCALRATKAKGFIAGAYLLLDPREGALSISLAGHPPPFVGRPGSCRQLDTPGALPLGVRLPRGFETQVSGIRPGDTVALFSDGALDMKDRDGRDLGSLLPEELARHCHKEPAALLEALIEVIREHRGGQPQDDDITVIIVKYRRRGS